MSETDNMEFGDRLKSFRLSRNLSQRQLAEEINSRTGYYYTVQAVSKWEHNKFKPEQPVQVVIAEILGTTVDELLTGKKDIDVKWEFHNHLHDINHMKTFLKSHMNAMHHTQTLKIIPMLDTLYGDAKRNVVGQEVPFIAHPLTVACHSIALGCNDDRYLSVALLHDILEGGSMDLDELPIDEETKAAIEILTYRPDSNKSDEENKREYYEGIKNNQIACFIKVLARCNNISVVAMSMSKEKMIDYIRESEEYVLPLINNLRYTWPERYDAAYLLRYHMMTAIEIMKRTI